MCTTENDVILYFLKMPLNNQVLSRLMIGYSHYALPAAKAAVTLLDDIIYIYVYI